MIPKNNKPDSITHRIGLNFSAELKDIKKERVEKEIDKKPKSTKVLTNLIVTHKDWGKIKRDTIKAKINEE